jgi:hypothetical protein
MTNDETCKGAFGLKIANSPIRPSNFVLLSSFVISPGFTAFETRDKTSVTE